MTIFMGIDWAETHHDICLLDKDGKVLATCRIPEGLEGGNDQADSGERRNTQAHGSCRWVVEDRSRTTPSVRRSPG